jgi:hypothetical protein
MARPKPGFRQVAVLLGGMFLVVGAALVWINSTDDPPSLAELTRERGTVGEVRRHTAARSAPYLTIMIDAGRYTVSSYSRAWFDSITAALPRGTLVTVWSREVPNGSGQVWQLQKGDSLVIAFDERKAAKEFRNVRVGQLGRGMVVLGLVGLVLSIVVRVRIQVARP